MKLVLLRRAILLTALVLVCGERSPMQESAPSVSFLALGDSYTIGEAVAADERWPIQLAGRLRSEGMSIAEPRIIARTGWTTDELDAAIDAAKITDRFDLVSLLIGVNNQYRGRSLEEYRSQFRKLLDRAISFADGDPARVVVLSIPDWGVTPFAEGRDRPAIAVEIDAFNAAAREEARESGVIFIDITPISRENDPALLAADGLHPSGLMYARWVDAILPVWPPR